MRPAVFLDRDGTLIEQVHHLIDSADVRLIRGAADAVSRLCAAGYVIVVATNQSVIGRGLLDETGLDEIHAEMKRQLAEARAKIDAVYFCPIKPTTRDSTAIEHPDRKPGPGMLLRASGEMELAIDRSWMIGDAISDVLAGRKAGVRGTIGVRTGYGRSLDAADPAIDYLVDDLAAAAELIVALDGELRGSGI